jgi:hypothetical protein
MSFAHDIWRASNAGAGANVPAVSCSNAMPTFRDSAGANLGSLPGDSVLTSVGTDLVVIESSAATAAAAACGSLLGSWCGG